MAIISRQLLVSILLVIMVTAALLLPLPDHGRIAGSMQNMLHVPVFALLGALCFKALSDGTKIRLMPVVLISVLTVGGFGLVTELIQYLVGRTASWQDALANLCGSFAGVVLAALMSGKVKRYHARLVLSGAFAFILGTTAPFLMLTDAIVQPWQMPILASYESRLEMFRWTCNHGQATRVQQYATHGNWSLRVDLGLGTYPGIVMVDPVSNWSGYEELVIDMFLPEGSTLEMIVKIQDAEHNLEYDDRFHRIEHLVEGENQVVIRLADVASAPQGREMDLQRIDKLSLFTVSPTEPRTFFVDNIRLR